MLRCIELGKKGLGSTAPNPMVGCVIVCNNKIIGEGYTSPYGGAHAEVNAINAVKDKNLLSKATLYVTLEPCSHFGKTPPCSDLIIKCGIPEVIVGLQDPHDKVAGAGLAKLEEAGCKTQVGILENECKKHHVRFLTFQEKKRPYIILKWAETRDGFIAPEEKLRKKSPKPFWISNIYSKQLVHKWRSEEQAILVGTTTVLADNPKLTARNWTGKNPLRIVLDKNLKIPLDYHVFDGNVKTIIFTEINDASKYKESISYELIDFSEAIASQICAVLLKHSITSVIIEGGSKTIQTFIDEGLWDEARIFKGNISFAGGTKAPIIPGRLLRTTSVLSDTLSTLIND